MSTNDCGLYRHGCCERVAVMAQEKDALLAYADSYWALLVAYGYRKPDATPLHRAAPAPAPAPLLDATDPRYVALWNAVNAYAQACGGHATRGGVPRMTAVAEVDRCLRALLAPAPAPEEPRCSVCGKPRGVIGHLDTTPWVCTACRMWSAAPPYPAPATSREKPFAVIPTYRCEHRFARRGDLECGQCGAKEPATGWPIPSPVDQAPETGPARDPSRCSLCGCPRIPLDRERTRFGACSLVPGRDGTGGCPEPLHDYYAEHPEKPPAPAAPTRAPGREDAE